ncbi:predicted protein [Arabidopsis lyrata subsp. lyrata]|uniref:Predicted protein n=1 Tax=Arabidopsis lyrata subsp. lyrata TaxID=81972 RepID=D7L7A8_ARALL|nr:predicted protein [Arabidopsis lyrata subsp. lyrata]
MSSGAIDLSRVCALQSEVSFNIRSSRDVPWGPCARASLGGTIGIHGSVQLYY